MHFVIAIGGGSLVYYANGSLSGLFAALALGLFVYGAMLVIAIQSGAWFRS